MRFYPGAFEYLVKASRRIMCDQCLYLVPEVDNNHDVNAVMLHNGEQKLGSVSADAAPELKNLLKLWKTSEIGKEYNTDDVIVCSLQADSVGYGAGDMLNFMNRGSIIVVGEYRVNERLARKFSNIQRSK